MESLRAQAERLLVALLLLSCTDSGAPVRQSVPSVQPGALERMRAIEADMRNAPEPYWLRNGQARNLTNQLALRFSRGGSTIAPLGPRPSARTVIRLAAIRRDRFRRSLEETAPVPTGHNRVEYRHDDVVEWFANGPMGLEHGVRLQRRPRGVGPLRLEVSVRGALRARNVGGQIVLASGGTRLHYGKLYIRDAADRVLSGALDVEHGRIEITIDDVGATYPLVIDPLVWSAVTRLYAENPRSNDSSDRGDAFGAAVAAGGGRVAIGAPRHSGGGNTYLFEASGGTWIQGFATGGTDHGGYSVAAGSDTFVYGDPASAMADSFAFISTTDPVGLAQPASTRDLGTWTRLLAILCLWLRERSRRAPGEAPIASSAYTAISPGRGSMKSPFTANTLRRRPTGSC